LEGIWKEAVVANFNALSWHSPIGNEENHKIPVRIADLRAEILTWHLPNMKQEC
jgi:hypothetical protein